MALTYVALASVTVGSGGAANIEFTSIPGTYTDLLLMLSLREATASSAVPTFKFNGSTSGYTARELVGNGSSAYSDTNYGGSLYGVEGGENTSSSTANTFSNVSLYIPNYASSNNKSISTDVAFENNATFGLNTLSAGLWSNSAAITSIKIEVFNATNFAQYSTATLYGIKNTV